MFWNRKRDNSERLVQHRKELNDMAAALLIVADVDFDQATPLEQALVGTFFFGMVTAHGMTAGLTLPDIHALALIVFKESLHYTDSAAAQAVQESINATSPGYHDTMNAILHRGIDGHAQYLARNTAGLRENINSILEHFRKLEE